MLAKQHPTALQQCRLSRRVGQRESKDILPDHPAHAVEEPSLDSADAVVAERMAANDEETMLGEDEAPQVHCWHRHFCSRPVTLLCIYIAKLIPAAGDHLHRGSAR